MPDICDLLVCLSVSLFVCLSVCLSPSKPTTPHDHGSDGSSAGASPDKSGPTLRAVHQSFVELVVLVVVPVSWAQSSPENGLLRSNSGRTCLNIKRV